MNPDDIGKTADAVKATAQALTIPDEVKTEALKPMAKSFGQVSKALVDLVFSPLIQRGIIKRAKLDSLAAQAVQFFEDHPNASYDQAKSMLLIKEFEDSRYSIDDDYMRTRFAKLLSNTADKNTNSQITPMFSTVLSNLTPESAQSLKFLSKQVYTPAIWLKAVNEVGGAIEDSQIMYGLGGSDQYLSDGILDELSALGLISLSKHSPLVDASNKNVDPYAGLYDALNFSVKSTEANGINIQEFKGAINLTIFGKNFVKAVM